jgi:hypothetical protein
VCMMDPDRCACAQHKYFRPISYVRNDPVNLIDPDGRWPISFPGLPQIISPEVLIPYQVTANPIPMAWAIIYSGIPNIVEGFYLDGWRNRLVIEWLQTIGPMAFGGIPSVSAAGGGSDPANQWTPQTRVGLQKAWKAAQDPASKCNQFLTGTLNSLGLNGEGVASLIGKLTQPGVIMENAPPDALGSEIYTKEGHVYVTSAAMGSSYLYARLIHEAFHLMGAVHFGASVTLQGSMRSANKNGEWVDGIDNETTNLVARNCGGINGPSL